MALLTKDAILKADDLKTEDVEVPEWGGSLRLRALTGAERDTLEESLVEQKGKHQKMNMLNFRAKLVASSAVDEKGHRIFDEKDIRALSNKNAGALDRLAAVASKLSGMSPEDVEELTDSSFGNAQSGPSTSD